MMRDKFEPKSHNTPNTSIPQDTNKSQSSYQEPGNCNQGMENNDEQVQIPK